jgi:hypothetical protein
MVYKRIRVVTYRFLDAYRYQCRSVTVTLPMS